MMKHIHFIGIGGSGLSAIARVLLEKGYTVSGSDQSSSVFTSELASLGALINIGHKAENITGADLIVRSSAIQNHNPEVQAAISTSIPVLKRSEFLETLTEGKRTLAVAGTHGKTTTTAMLAWVLTRLEMDPSYIIGGISKNLKNNAHAGTGEYFVIEADEYDRMFLGLHPEAAIVTNMELDHPDCFPTFEKYIEAFKQFVSLLRPNGRLMVCFDHPETARLYSSIPAGCRLLTYGISQEADYFAQGVKTIGTGGYLRFDAYWRNATESPVFLSEIQLQIPGKHNVRNALATIAVAHQFGLSVHEVASALAEYKGVERRFDVLGVAGDITIINDYAHHPTEIKTTLEAARLCYPDQNIWVLWQPHTFSRTQTLMNDYVHAFEQADHVVITEVYSAREENNGFSSEQVVNRMPAGKAHFINALSQASSFLLANLKKNDVLLVLSAGDANQVSVDVLNGLQKSERQNG